MDLLSLPIVMIENIVSYLSYDEIAKNRVVCKSFNEICMRMLNRGFLVIERRHAIALKTVKAQLPRRESERRYHPLSRHCDILSSIETRISMLNMTYSKFMDSGLCCFIPGRVIDEIRRILTLVESTQTPPRAHEVLQELRDISSMAIEHFDEKISPAFRKRLQDGVTGVAQHNHAQRNDTVLGPIALKQELLKIRRRSMLNAKLSLFMAAQFRKLLARYQRVTMRQRQTIRSFTLKQKEQDAAIAELKKRIEECDVKYSELTHTNQAAGGKTIAASPSAGVVTSQPLRHFASQIKLDLSVLPIGTAGRGHALLPNIKPRKPRIKLPSFSEDQEPPTKRPKSDEPHENQAISPSTSQERTVKTRSQAKVSTVAKLKDFAKEMRNFAKNTDLFMNTPRLGKRSLSFSALDEEIYPTSPKEKKQKID